jgi:hypothetical protein
MPWCDDTVPEEGRSLRDQRDLPNLRLGSIGETEVCRSLRAQASMQSRIRLFRHHPRNRR